VFCRLCPQECKIQDGKRGICLTRVNKGGVLYSENYGRVVSLAMDPIEKKPLYHFYPGARILSCGPNGCNIKCLYCQNCEISQVLQPTQEMPAANLIGFAQANHSIGIAYTYTEPFIWMEYLLEAAPLAQEKGLKNVLVTNGFVNEKPLNDVLPFIHAMNIDIKSMDPEFYKKICKGKLSPVLKTCETSKKKCHIEITNLLITDLNDTEEWITALVNYVARNLGDDTPLHFSRYFPHHKMNREATPANRLELAVQIGKSRLKYVYAGNISLRRGSDTLCPTCNAVLVERSGYSIKIMNLKESQCSRCNTRLNFIM
jgi:pyruvate formate lyase activating enzyme